MVRKKIVANAVGLFGIASGIFTGVTIINAELYLNPMDYHDNHFKLALPFYAAFSMISTPFLFIRKAIFSEEHKIIWGGSAALCIFALSLPFLFEAEIIQTFMITVICLLFPILVFDVFKPIWGATSPKRTDNPL